MSWYHHFFHGLPQEAWQAAQTPEQTQLELELIVETLAFGPSDQVLDIFCGHGRHALPLARMGATVTGVDISAESIEALQGQAQAENLPLQLIQGDFLTTTALDSATGQFDAAYCLGNSLAFFPYDDMLRFFQRIAQLLRPGGRLLVHSGMVAETFLPDFQERSWLPVGKDITVVIHQEYEPIHSRIEQQLIYYQTQADGSTRSETRTAHYYLYTLAELTRLFTQAGLGVEALYGTVDQEPFMLGDEAVWVVLAKE